VTACLLLLIRQENLRRVIVIFASVCLAAASIALLSLHGSLEITLSKNCNQFVSNLMLVAEMAIAGFLIWKSLRYRYFLAAFLVLVQTVIMLGFEFRYGHTMTIESDLFIDRFSILMALVIGVIGGLICIYALGYMKDYHRHAEMPDHRNRFFFIFFLFLSAMFGVVFSNNLLWCFFFWEITTLCSFLLIGYKPTDECRANAFNALTLNLIGGLGFVAGILYSHFVCGTVELDKLLNMRPAMVLVPAVLISFAGLAKAAQLPFSSWLLGAMVAPTPVSALLHSSTMVKAGVYIIVRFAGIFEGTVPGLVLAFIGGFTFLMTSFMAVSQSDAKRVLAYSTIANLGLIVLCAGVGTYEAVWAALLLIVFHAASKCLLFLCVGSVEHRIGSRNIEDMSGLVLRLPKIAIMMEVGMAGMFLAPFGMLVSKWAVLKALADYNPFLAVLVIFGSSVTLFFWAKWIGKIITVERAYQEDEIGPPLLETVPLLMLAVLTVLLCGLFPVLSGQLIEPYVYENYHEIFSLGEGNIIIMLIMLGVVMLFPLSFFMYGKRVKVVEAYLSGLNIQDSVHFRDSFNQVRGMGMNNYYLIDYFGEKRLFSKSIITGIVLTLLLLVVPWIF